MEEHDAMCCRACLVQRRRMCLLSQRANAGSLTYADLLRSCANVKIHANDTFSDKICSTCRRKAEEAYEFKILVEQSDKTLWLHKHTPISASTKKLNFDNVTDIKVEIEGCKAENILENHKDNANDIELDFKNGAEKIFYKNTSIKKLIQTETMDSCPNDQSQIHVEDFLNTIVKKEADISEVEEDNFYQDDWIDQGENDDEYIPPGYIKKSLGKSKHNNKKKMKKNRKDEKTIEHACHTKAREDVKKQVIMTKGKEKIKPVVLDDFRLVPAKPDKPRKYTRANKEKKSYQSFICPYCGLVSKNIKSHILIHTGERNHKCNVCSKAYFTSKMLEHHMQSHGKRNFKCDKCDAAFYIKGSLQNHMKCHEDTKNMVCNICSKAFKRKTTLRRHVHRHSSANKTIKCELCNMTFFEPGNLRHHMRVHTGERPFKCELCSQPYSYGRDFIRHCLKKHGCRFRGSEVRVMTEEVLQQYRARMREEQEKQRNAEAVHSILPLPTITVDPAAIASHQLDLQLKILSGELR